MSTLLRSLQSSSSRTFDLQQLHLKNQVCIGWDSCTSSTFSVTIRGGDFEFTFFANTQITKSFIPSFDYLARSHYFPVKPMLVQ